MDIRKESKSILFLLIIVIVSVVIMFAFSFGMEKLNTNNNYNWPFYFFGYLGILFLFGWLEKKYPNKLLKYTNIVISIPIAIFLVATQFTLPTMGLIIHVIFFCLLSFIVPLIFLKTNNYFGYINLTESAGIFLTLSIGSITAITFYKKILNIIYKFGPFRIKDSQKMKKYKLDELTEYVLNIENIRFIIYTSFFIYLMIFSFQFLQENSIFEMKEKDKAVYQSFLCFLAYDRLLLNSSRFILLPSVLLKKVINSIRGNEEKEKL